MSEVLSSPNVVAPWQLAQGIEIDVFVYSLIVRISSTLYALGSPLFKVHRGIEISGLWAGL